MLQSQPRYVRHCDGGRNAWISLVYSVARNTPKHKYSVFNTSHGTTCVGASASMKSSSLKQPTVRDATHRRKRTNRVQSRGENYSRSNWCARLQNSFYSGRFVCSCDAKAVPRTARIYRPNHGRISGLRLSRHPLNTEMDQPNDHQRKTQEITLCSPSD